MKQFGRVGIWMVAGLQIGCSGCSGGVHSTQPLAVAAPGDVEPVAFHDDHARPIRHHEAPSVQANAGNYHAASHAPHTFAMYRPVDLHQLPKLVVRTSCFPNTADYGTHYAPTKRHAAASTGPGNLGISGSGVGGGGYGSGHARLSAPKPAQKPKTNISSTLPMAAAPEGRAQDSYGFGAVEAEKKAESRVAPSQPADAKSPSAAPRPEAVAAERARSKDLSADKRAASSMLPEPKDYHDWGASLYLSNDDTMSLSSAQRVLYAIDRGMDIPPDHIRPHEFLNYFSFDTAPVHHADDFSVHASIAPKPGEHGIYTLGLAVSGRDLTRETRRNAGLTLVVDRSGSMAEDGRMDYLKQGLQRMTSELKAGDLVNVVLFDDQVCTPLENFVVGRDSMSVLTDTIRRMEPSGSTDLNAGLVRGYQLANESFNDAFTNRVVLISDAIANTGITDPNLMSTVTQNYDKRRIRLSGVGVGRDFNDSLLDKLTEKGKGAYVFLGSEAEVDAVFGNRFVSLIETIANDVHFQVQLPPSLRMNVFYGEESSVNRSDVQAIHYFAGTSQLFLSDLMARNGAPASNESIKLTVEYEHPETGVKQSEQFLFPVDEIRSQSHNLNKGRLITSFIDGVKDIELSHGRYSNTHYASEQCAAGQHSLQQQAQSLRQDPEVDRVLDLWSAYCRRFPQLAYHAAARPDNDGRHPVRRDTPRGQDVWPGAR